MIFRARIPSGYAPYIATVAAMLLAAIAGASFGAAFFSDPYIQEMLLEHSDQLWENPTFMRIAEMVGLI